MWYTKVWTWLKANWKWLIFPVWILSLALVFLFKGGGTVVGLNSNEREKLLDLELDSKRKELALEQEKNKKLQEVAIKLQSSLTQIAAELEKAKDKIDVIRHEEIERLRTDTDAASRELDKLLGIGG